MHIAYDQKLTDYMQRKGYAAIVVETVSAIGCCADTTELATRFVKQPEAQELKAKGCAVHEGDVGEVLIVTRGLHYDDTVTFGLRSFFGAKDVVVKGISPWKL